LLTGQFKAGSDLIQTQLAERYDVSRIPIRDALRELADDGLVLIDETGTARVISLDADEIREIYDLRVLLECDCLATAASRLDGAAIDEIDRVRRKGDLDARTPDWALGDWYFHSAIYRHARRPRQLRIISNLRQTCQLLIATYHQLPVRSTAWLRDHAAIVAHLRDHEFDQAVNALRRHIEGARDHLLRLVGLQSTPPSASTRQHQ
jgi:DNA-binding GntR family transcriptional regulator